MEHDSTLQHEMTSEKNINSATNGATLSLDVAKESFNKGVAFILEHLLCPMPAAAKECYHQAAEDRCLLVAQQTVIDTCFQKAQEQIASMPQHDYEDLLASLVCQYLEPGYDEIVFNLRDKNRLSLIRFIVLLNTKVKQTGKVLPLLNIASETTDAVGGFLLKNGEKRIDCTIETLLAKQKEALSLPLSEILFGNSQ